MCLNKQPWNDHILNNLINVLATYYFPTLSQLYDGREKSVKN